MASSVDEPEAAYARSQRDEPCEVVYDTVISHGEALASYVAFLQGDDRVTNPRVLANKMVTNEVALAYVDEIQRPPSAASPTSAWSPSNSTSKDSRTATR